MAFFIRYRQGAGNITEYSANDASASFASGDLDVVFDGEYVTVTADDTIELVGVLLYEYPLSSGDVATISAIDPWTWGVLTGDVTDLDLNATTGAASAAGVDADLVGGAGWLTTTGNATAAGTSSAWNVGVVFTVTTASATANGIAGHNLTGHMGLTSTVGNSTLGGAESFFSNLEGETFIIGTANADAAGHDASFNTSITLNATTGASAGAGLAASFVTGAGLDATTGNAVADGLLHGLSITFTAIQGTTGDAVADGLEAGWNEFLAYDMSSAVATLGGATSDVWDVYTPIVRTRFAVSFIGA